MSEVVLSGVVVIESALLALTLIAASRERKRLLHAIISRDPAEYARLEAVSNRPRKVKAAKSDPPQPYGL